MAPISKEYELNFFNFAVINPSRYLAFYRCYHLIALFDMRKRDIPEVVFRVQIVGIRSIRINLLIVRSALYQIII